MAAHVQLALARTALAEMSDDEFAAQGGFTGILTLPWLAGNTGEFADQLN